METEPLQVSTVYAITLKTPADRTVNETIEETDTESSEEVIVGGDLIPMVMVNGEIYMDTGHESTVEARCGVMDGEITSTVDGTEHPAKDNESNFGTGYGYQYGTQEGLIEIYMNDKWWVFATEKALASSQLMIETNDNYNLLSEADRANVSFDIADPGYDFEGDDVKKLVSLLKPETWEKGTLTLELSAIEHVIFYNGNMKYVVAIRDVGNNEVLFELYSATNGNFNNDSCYYKTDDVGYKELMDQLRDMCN